MSEYSVSPTGEKFELPKSADYSAGPPGHIQRIKNEMKDSSVN